MSVHYEHPMHAAKLRGLATSAFALSLALTPSPARATPPSRDPSGQVARTLAGPIPRWLGGGDGGERYAPPEPRGFVGGDFILLTASSSHDALLLGRLGDLTGGVEFPTRQSWTFVPRLHFSIADGGSAGRIRWTRLALDGRLSTIQGGTLSYEEVGVGMGYFDYPVTVTDLAYMSHTEQRSCGTPFAQATIGKRGVPNEGPPLMVEFIVALGVGAESPGAISLVAGIEF